MRVKDSECFALKKKRVSERDQIMMGVRNYYTPQHLICNGRELKNYKGYKGYNSKYGSYVGTLGAMMFYLRFQNEKKWAFYDSLLRQAGRKKSCNLSKERINEIKKEVFELLDYDIQRKFFSKEANTIMY